MKARLRAGARWRSPFLGPLAHYSIFGVFLTLPNVSLSIIMYSAAFICALRVNPRAASHQSDADTLFFQFTVIALLSASVPTSGGGGGWSRLHQMGARFSSSLDREPVLRGPPRTDGAPSSIHPNKFMRLLLLNVWLFSLLINYRRKF